jgi:hypothetical protein
MLMLLSLTLMTAVSRFGLIIYSDESVHKENSFGTQISSLRICLLSHTKVTLADTIDSH